jgi:hypothetical protein
VAERFVVLGVAGARRRWLGRVAGWATSAALPVELVTALDAGEARAVLAAGQPVSALLVDAAVALDRDLVALAEEREVAVVAVAPAGDRADLDALGCDDVLHDPFGPGDLHDALRRCARPVGRDRRAADITRSTAPGPAADSTPTPLVAVTGSGGAGASTVAMALAQGLARHGRRVVLVDGCRRGDHAMYHDLDDPVPGLPELLTLCRADRPDPARVRELVRPVGERGYGLLPGWRRPGDWSASRRRTVAAALDALRRAADAVVVDHDPDLEDETATGVPDVEDRHAVALTAAGTADLVLVVGRPGVHGIHALARQLDLQRDAGADPSRLVPVLNGAPRAPAGRALLVRTLAELSAARARRPVATCPPVLLAQVPGVDASHLGADPLPRRLVDPLDAAVRSHLARLGPRDATDHPPAIRAGTLGRTALVDCDEVA